MQVEEDVIHEGLAAESADPQVGAVEALGGLLGPEDIASRVQGAVATHLEAVAVEDGPPELEGTPNAVLT